jgi:acyl dehydratase
VVALRRISDAVFKRPVVFGDTIHVESRVEALAPVGDGLGLTTCVWTIVNQDGRTVARAAVEVLWRRAEVLAEVAA